METKPYRHGVNAIIVDRENRFLVVQKVAYKDNEWTVVGGGREAGETLEQTLYRELEEELALKRGDFEMIGISTHTIEYDYPPDVATNTNGGAYRGQSYDQVVLRFIGDAATIVYATDEFKRHAWVDASELATRFVFPKQYLRHKLAIDELLPKLIQPPRTA